MATYVSSLGTVVFANKPFDVVDELIQNIVACQGSGTAGGQLYLEIKGQESRFLSFECTNIEGELSRKRLKKMIEVAQNPVNSIETDDLVEAFTNWRPTKVSSVLPSSMREMMLNWLANQNCADHSFTGKWIFGGFLVWLDLSTSPEPRFRYCILSTMTGVARFTAWQLDQQQDSKRTRLLVDSSE